MRIRTIKPEFFTHEGLYELELETGLPVRVAFAGLWCAADRDGRFKWEPRRLGVQILPYDNIDFSRVLDALTTRAFTRHYRVDGKDFGVIPSFKDHQVINNREKPSELPEPLEYIDCDACLTREPRVGHASKAEGKGREGNMEGKGKDFDASATRQPASLRFAGEFESFWQNYPRKIGKGNAEKAWAKLNPPISEVLAAIEWQRMSKDWLKDGGQFIPHPATWLNRKGWQDEQTEIIRADAALAF